MAEVKPFPDPDPVLQTVWGEVVTEEPLLNKFGPLFVSQLMLLAWNLVLFGATVADIYLEDQPFNWRLFGQIWIGVDTGLMLLMWLVYKLWFDACRTLPFKGQERPRARGYIVGMSMHSTIHRVAMIVTFLFTAIVTLFSYILEVTDEFKNHFEHTTSVRLLQTLMTFSFFNCGFLWWSLMTQIMPIASVQNVMVFVPSDKVRVTCNKGKA